jgi:hypothetical protein
MAAGLGPDQDAARARVAQEGLTPDAVGKLTGVVSGLSLESLGPVKQLLKRFFSDHPWTEADDDDLAEAIGPSAEEGRAELRGGLVLSWNCEHGRFRLRLEDRSGPGEPE